MPTPQILKTQKRDRLLFLVGGAHRAESRPGEGDAHEQTFILDIAEAAIYADMAEDAAQAWYAANAKRAGAWSFDTHHQRILYVARADEAVFAAGRAGRTPAIRVQQVAVDTPDYQGTRGWIRL